MLTGSSLVDPVLINTIGHTAGVLLFGFIITLFLQDRRSHGISDIKRSILAAALALAWNVGSLIALGSNPDSLFLQIVMTASFAALSLLPAVLLQVTLQGQLARVTYAGYVISGTAIFLHVAELFVNGFMPHQLALLLIAGGFGTLSVIAIVANRRIRPSSPANRTEWLSLTCLLLFASSFPHFGYQHFRSPWTAEIAWHHIGIPVALIVLLQDYRFLLLDTFTRFLVNSGLAAAYVICLLTLNKHFHLLRLISSSVFLSGIAIVALCLSLILFADVRNLLQRWIGRGVFHRQNLNMCIRAITELSAKTQSEEALISGAAREVAAHLRVERFTVVSELHSGEKPNRPGMLLAHPGDNGPAAALVWAEAQTPLRFSSGEVVFLLTGPRRGRQRYLSEDLEDMRRLASIIVEQVERFRAEELKRLAAQAELRALQAQINPHFLFNAFNTLYGTIDRGSFEARRLVLNLTEIFRYFLQGDRVAIPLSEELRIIKAYLEIEALRLGDRLQIELDVSEAALPVMIPILSVQPLVENAVKHGIAGKTGPGRVTVRAHTEDGMLRITIKDKSEGIASSSVSLNGSGVGLANVRRRLQLSYGSDSSLDVSYGVHGSIATLLIPTTMKAAERGQKVEAAG
jgi:two-component system, LytTR family, sensor kinase